MAHATLRIQLLRRSYPGSMHFWCGIQILHDAWTAPHGAACTDAHEPRGSCEAPVATYDAAPAVQMWQVLSMHASGISEKHSGTISTCCQDSLERCDSGYSEAPNVLRPTSPSLTKVRGTDCKNCHAMTNETHGTCRTLSDLCCNYVVTNRIPLQSECVASARAGWKVR